MPGGKEDDFLSDSAREYVLEGRTSVRLEPELAEASEDARRDRVEELIGYKQIAIAFFLTEYLVEKEEGEDENFDFGGFGGLARAGAFEDLGVVQEDELTYSFTFRQLVAGPNDLMELLPIEVGEDGEARFDLVIGKPSNQEMARLETGNSWYRDPPWASWSPAEAPDELKETIRFAIERERESTDAWFDFESLFADGVLDIDVHFGWDYHDAYHLQHARSLFHWLEARGFEAPVNEFEDLDRESGPFTRTLLADGREVTVEVRIFYPISGGANDPDTDAGGQVLEQDMRASLAERDAVMFSGHSGPFYGFALGNWRQTLEGDLDDSEMRSVEMPEERYQIVFAEGCDTYQIGQAFRENPAKPDGRFLDVITTTSFSAAGSPAAVQDFISRLTDEDGRGRHQPRTLLSLLEDLDGNAFWMNTMYGIHGIDDNPALHPYARPDRACLPCEDGTDCGGVGNLCVGAGESGSICAPECSHDRGCPDGFACREIADDFGFVFARACVPAAGTCAST